MPQMSSEEALNNIFNLLNAMMNKFAETDKKKAEGKSEDNVSRLINGLIDSSDSKAAANAGLQLESLAKGMNEISKIDANQIKAVSASIETINNAMNKFTVPTNTIDGVDDFIEAIQQLGKIDGNIANNLNQFISGTKDSFALISDLSQTVSNLHIQSDLLDSLDEFTNSFSSIQNIDSSILADINDKFNNLSLTLNGINMPSDIARQLNQFAKSINSFERIDTRSLSQTAKQVENASKVLNKINILKSTIDGINDFMSAAEGIKNIDVSTLKTLADLMGLIASTVSNFKVDKNIKANIEQFVDSISDLKDINSDSADSIKGLTANLKDAITGLNTVLSSISSVKIPKDVVNDISAVIGTFSKLESIDADSFSNISDNIDNLMNSLSDLDISDDFIKDVDTLSKALQKLSGTNIDIKGLGNLPELSSALKAIQDIGSIGDNIDNIVSSIDNLDKIDEGSIDKLKTFIQSLKIDNAKEIRDSATIVVLTIKALSEISKINTKSLNRSLNRIKPELADNIVQFVVKLTKELQKYDVKEILRIIKPISNLFSGLNAIISTNVFKMKISLNPLRGFLLGRQIGTFVKAISKYVKDANIPKSIKNIAGILDPIAKFADPKNKFSIWKLKKALNKRTAKVIAKFFIAICEEINNKKTDLKVGMYNIEKLMETLLKFSVFMAVHFKVATMMLSISSAKKVNKFLHTLVEGKWDTKKVDALGKFINRLIFTFTGALAAIIAVVAIAPMSAVITGFAVMYYGLKGIKKLILDITDPKTGIKKKQAKSASEVLKSVLGVIFAVSATIGGIAVISALFGMEHVILSLIITRFAITGITKIIAQLAQKEISENTGKSAKTFKEISLLLMSVTGAIVILTLLSKFTSPEDMLLSTGILAIAFGAVTGIIIWLTHKIGEEDIETATDAMKDISRMLMILTASIAILAIVNLFTDSIWPAFGVVALTVALMATTVAVLSHKIKKKDLDSAVKTIHAFTLMVLGITASIAVLSLLFNKFDDGVVWQGLAVVGVVVGMMAGIVWFLSNKVKKKDLSLARKTLITLTACLVIISLVAETLLIPIGKHLGDALKGAGTVIVILGVLVLMTKWLTTFRNKKLQNALTALAVLTACLAVVSLVTKFLLIPIGAEAEPALYGAAVTIGIVLALVGILYVVTKIGNKELKHSLVTLGVLTAELLIISLIIKTLLIPIGYDATNAFQGALVAAGVVLAMIGMTYLLTLIDDKSMKHSLITMGVLTVILVAVAATIKFLLIPIGENAKEAMYGAGIAIGVVLVMVGMTFLLSLIKKEVLVKNLITMAALTAMLVVVSLTTKYLLIPIGKEAKAALYGAGVALGIVTAMLGMVWLIGNYISKASEQMKLGMLEGAGFLAISAGILWLIGKAVPPFVDVARMVGEDPGKIALGGAIILAAITWITALMVGVGMLCENPMAMLAVGIGAAVVAAATGVLWGIGKIMLTFTEVIEAIKNYDAKTLLQSAKGIGILLAAMGESLAGVIALSPLATIGAGAMIPLSAAVFGLFKLFTYTANNILELNKKITVDDIKKFNGLIYNKDKSNDPNTLIGSINNIMAGLKGLGFWRSVLTSIMSLIIRPIINTVSQFIDIILKVATAHYVIGYDDNGKPIYEKIPEGSFGRAASQVSNGFAEFLTKVNEGFNALDADVKTFGALYAKTLKPIVKLVGQFVDIVMKVATGTYITGYDDNGKPEYKHLSAKEFGDAGTLVSLQFAIFLGAINEGFKNMEALAIANMEIMKDIMEPVIKQLSQFVDIVMKVATSTYVTGYDDNGKPEFEKLSAQDFTNAGKAVTELFSFFLDSLNKSFSLMSMLTIISMLSMKKAVGPIMEMLSKFVDAVMKVATGTYISGYDEEGHAEITHIENEDFIEAGVAVAATFGYFIDSLNESFSKLSPTTIDAIKSMDGSLKPIMESVSSFVDAIIKYASGQYIYAYDKDKDGNYTVPLFAKISDTDMSDAAESIAKNFALFIENITASFDKGGSFWGNKTEDALEAIAESIGPIMEGLGSYVDAIILVATGSYIDHMEKDKDGKLQPVYKHLEPKLFGDAATMVARMFVRFVNTLIKKFSDEKFKEKAKNLQDIISESIKPIMDAVKDFSEALKPFLNIKKQTTDAKGKKSEEFVCFQKGMIVLIANDIANGFVSFIKIISEGLTNDQMKNYYKEVKKVSKSVSETLDNIKKAAVNLGKTIKALNGENGVVEKGDSSARAFIAVLDIFANYFKGNVSFEDSVDPAKQCSQLMKIIADIAKRFKNIIQGIANIDDKKLSQTEVINKMNKNILSMANNMVAVSDAIANVNFSNIYELLNAYTNMSMKYMELSMMMSRNPEMEDGFMKFVRGMHKLTNAGLQDNISKTGFAITKYTTHLNRFTVQVRLTTEEVKVYVTAMESARKILAKFDEQIISKAKQREQALQNLADKINNIADAIDNMRGAFEALDEESIIERFDGIKKLLELAGIYDKDEGIKKDNTNKTAQNKSQRSSRPTPQRQAGNTYNTYGGRTSGHVTFQFANTVLDGTFKMA